MPSRCCRQLIANSALTREAARPRHWLHRDNTQGTEEVSRELALSPSLILCQIPSGPLLCWDADHVLPPGHKKLIPSFSPFTYLFQTLPLTLAHLHWVQHPAPNEAESGFQPGSSRYLSDWGPTSQTIRQSGQAAFRSGLLSH